MPTVLPQAFGSGQDRHGAISRNSVAFAPTLAIEITPRNGHCTHHFARDLRKPSHFAARFRSAEILRTTDPRNSQGPCRAARMTL